MSAQWRRTLNLGDVFRNDEMSFAERRDEMVRRIRALDPAEDDTDLQALATGLSETEDVDEWDDQWDDFYDWADAARVWVQTWPTKPGGAS